MKERFERRDINPRSLGLIALMLIVSLILSSLATALLYRSFSLQTQTVEGPIGPPLPPAEAQFPAPQLQIYPPDELLALRQKEEAILTSYGWVDRKSGVVRIPIERAMNLVAEQGNQPILGAPGLPQGPTWPEMMRRRAQEGTEITP